MVFTLPAAVPWPAEVPVTPDADEARRWAAEELSKQLYLDAKPGPLQEFLSWLWQEFQDFLNALGSLESNLGLLLVLGIAVVVIIAAVLVIRPRLNRRRAKAAGIFAGAAQTTSDGHRVLAAQAEAAGDLATAIAETFRAMVRSAEERDVLAPAPGRTAVEVTAELAHAFPELETSLHRAAGTFDAIHYGHAQPTPGLYAEFVDLDVALGKSRPRYADPVEVVQA